MGRGERGGGGRRPRRGLGPRGVAILLGALALLVGWIAVTRATSSPTATADASVTVLDHIPPGAMLVASLDVAALRNTPLGEQLLGQGRTVAGLGEVSALCGADPMDRVDELAIAVPGGAEDAGFGFFARGRIDAGELLGCAEKIVKERGGRPVRVPAGRFWVLKDASLELSSAELAVADGGPIVLAEPSYVRAALGTEGGSSMRSDAQHSALVALVPRGQLVATAVLSAEQRRALVDELMAQNMGDSPFRSVVGGALSLTVTDAVTLAVALRCEQASACARVAEHVRQAARAEADTLAARAIGLSGILAGLDVRLEGDAVHVRVVVPAAEALTMLRRALALRQLAEPGATKTGPTPAPAPAPDARGAGGEDDGVAAGGAAGLRIEAAPRPSASARP